jgi:hypothetical protein
MGVLPRRLFLFLSPDVIASHPGEQEADYSRAPVQNIVNTVVPNQGLFDA